MLITQEKMFTEWLPLVPCGQAEPASQEQHKAVRNCVIIITKVWLDILKHIKYENSLLTWKDVIITILTRWTPNQWLCTYFNFSNYKNVQN